MLAYVLARVRACACVYAHACVCACVRTFMCICAWVRVSTCCARACMLAYVLARMLACVLVHVCMRACVRAYVFVCVQVFVCEREMLASVFLSLLAAPNTRTPTCTDDPLKLGLLRMGVVREGEESQCEPWGHSISVSRHITLYSHTQPPPLPAFSSSNDTLLAHCPTLSLYACVPTQPPPANTHYSHRPRQKLAVSWPSTPQRRRWQRPRRGRGVGQPWPQAWGQLLPSGCWPQCGLESERRSLLLWVWVC